MASLIQSAIGYDQQASVTPITPQPARPDVIHHALITRGGGALSYPQGFRQTILLWNSTDRDAFPAIMAKLGLSKTVLSAENTFSLEDEFGDIIYFNAVAEYREDMRIRWFNEDLRIHLNRIEEVAAP